MACAELSVLARGKHASLRGVEDKVGQAVGAVSGGDKTTLPRGKSAADNSEEVTARILAAAQQEFEMVGIRRSSVSDIARRAGMGRATVYRRFPGRDSLVEAVAGRELIAVLARVASNLANTDNAADAIVQLTVASARELRTNPLLNRLLTTEPEELYGYAAKSGGTALAAARTFVAGYLESLPRHGLAHGSEPAVAAEIMIRLAMTQLLIPDGLIPFYDDVKVAAFAQRYLVPLATGTVHDSM